MNFQFAFSESIDSRDCILFWNPLTSDFNNLLYIVLLRIEFRLNKKKSFSNGIIRIFNGFIDGKRIYILCEILLLK